MSASFIVLGLTIYLNLSSFNVVAERKNIHQMIYETFDNAAVCFRVLNGTHQFGCSSASSGNTGVVHFINSTDDLNWVLQKSKAEPYMAVVHPNMFIKEVMSQLNESPKISGVLLVVNKTLDKVESFTPDDTCPNRYSGLNDSCDESQPWNPDGSSFLLVDWKKPMFIVKELGVVKKIHDCFNMYNLPLDDSQSQRPLCSLQMKSHMHAAVDSRTCIYRNSLMVMGFNPQSYCDPMGDLNIVSTLFPRTMPSIQNRSTILVVARMDSASMFDGLAPGAMTAVSGIVTLLTTAKVLKDMLATAIPNIKYNVMFALFNGEAHDYIGSSRVVYDMKGMKFPMSDLPFKLEEIEFIIDISQLSRSKNIQCHYLSSNGNELIQKVLSDLNTFGTKRELKITGEPSQKFLPPSSLQTFLKEKPSLPGLIMTNHGKQYVNRFYNSFMDTSSNLGYVYANGSTIETDSVQSVLASTSVTLAETLFTLITDSNPVEQNMKPITTLMDELLYCYLESADCEVFRNTTSVELPFKPLNLYVGVARVVNTITKLTSLVLMQWTGKAVNFTEEVCKEKANLVVAEVDYSWIVPANGNAQCVETTVKLLTAVSPAFEIEDYNWASGEYSTWTESVWQELNLRMFLKPARNQEILLLLSGLAVVLISFVSVYWINNRADELFSNQLCVRC